MENGKKILIAPPDSPYRILGVDWEADSKAILKAMRDLFRKDPRKGGQLGNRAQKKLTDPKEKVKEDIFCCEMDKPEIDLKTLESEVGHLADDVFCFALEDLSLFSDLHFSNDLKRNIKTDMETEELPYREKYDRRKT